VTGAQINANHIANTLANTLESIGDVPDASAVPNVMKPNFHKNVLKCAKMWFQDNYLVWFSLVRSENPVCEASRNSISSR